MNNDPKDPNEALHELAGEYVIGTLSAEDRDAVEKRLAVEPELQAAVDYWEARLLYLTDLVEPKTPSPRLWNRIERSLDETSRQAAPVVPARPNSWWDSLSLWRGFAAAGMAATLVLGAVLLTRLSPAPSPTWLVVLATPQDLSPGWVVQASNQTHEIELIPLGVTELPPDKALQLWTKAEGWQAPVSLGLVKPGEPVRIRLDDLPPLQPNQLFELTLEQPTGSPTGLPTGPIQFIGRAAKVI
ncbi:anti-sigma factor [Stutzerimonas xanthomarina]|uniref:anti-sigma factor n=1 Tax=Stutzerimonas xanthomarina TaxID=271420 RepID=UPI0029A7E81B|nr:anti-sigma factor [Stutzerimonas xanthomarina]MDX2353340.1 anti-sigma factor [Stutzerimonas xanthomarina]|tara:strand:- start:110 stop:838 length:729 start_codon:yes stop_codon:yes gene_type:complete